MAIIGEQLKVSELDFETIKANLIDYFKNSDTELSDWDYEGSNLNAIMDVLAYNTHYNAMLAHMAVNESFIDSAQLRSSIVSASKLLGYIPRSVSSAKIILKGSFIATENAPIDYIVPRGTIFSTNFDGTSYQFTVLNDVCRLYLDGGYYYTDPDEPIVAYQGRLVKASFEANGVDSAQRYELLDENIDLKSLRVFVYPTSSKSEGTASVFRRFKDINVNENTPIYFINENSFGRYELTFGNGIFGRKLNAGNVIEVEYLVTDGVAANGINTPFILSSSIPYIVNSQELSSINGQKSGGGGSRETNDTLKINAINNFGTQNRGVTADDYKNLIKATFSEIEAISVWGGEDHDPPTYGKVFISAKTKNDLQISNITKEQILNYLSNKKVLAIIPEIIDPKYTNIVLDILVKYNSNITALTPAELQTELRNNVLNFYNDNILNEFDTVFRHSQFIRSIDTYSRSILNSLVRVYLKQKITINNTDFLTPAELIADGNNNPLITDYTIDFGAPLTPDDGTTIIAQKTLGGNPWRENGERVYLGDEPTNNINIRNVYLYNITESGISKIRDVGTLDLPRGIMQVSRLYSDEDVEVEFTVNSKSYDIVGKRNNLLRIDVNDSIVRVYPDEIALGGNSRSVSYDTFSKDR